ncbi:hypothetical protein QAD02_006653 [Eretmocerus hayati]|uniref:Uncharacterized protein n=1 Tax=Eretmocerus hayati TaxID=131215 RepID=A0ACC2N2N7_9HYME|nr:hypothetical protein QAD02_006653 [Eretmocerus hayati]
MDDIEKVELEWQKIWLQILTGLFLSQGVNETVHDFAESTGKGPKQPISCAINHSIGKSKYGEEVHEARHVIIAQDEISENRRLEKELEYLQPVRMDFDDILKSSISKTFLSEMHVHENYATQNCGPAAVKEREVTGLESYVCWCPQSRRR